MFKKANMNFKGLMLLLFFLPMPLLAQTVQVSGKVTDAESGEALPGVTIVAKGTTIGTVTNFDGEYNLEVEPASTLLFSFVGYADKEMEVLQDDGKLTLDVQLEEKTQELEEIVVIGYGVQKKSDKTGAVASVQSDELNTGVLTDPIQGLVGKTAGVSITKKGGDPNAGFSVKIRGSSGFASNTDPLYVVDGVPGVDPTTIAPEDVQSYNILKDASSTAIYGSRGANGVIIIETKSGEGVEGSRVELNSYVAFDQVANRLDMLSADQMRQFADDNDLNLIDGGANTNWQDEVYRTGISQSHNFAISGGDDNTTYRASLTHSDWEGVIKGTSKTRSIGRLNLTQTAIDDRLTVSATLAGTVEANDYIDYAASGPNDVLYQMFQRNPTDPVYTEDGEFYETQRDFNYYNPVALIDQITNERDAKRFMGSLKADLELVDGLVAGVNLGYIRDDSESFYFEPSYYRGGATAGYGRRSYDNNGSKLMETTLTYTKTLAGVHNLNAVAGYSFQEDYRDGFSAQGREPLSDIIGPYKLEALNDVTIGDISSYYESSRLISFFGRVTYNYDTKYYATFTLRRDGSSRFGANNKWGLFPSGSLAWNIKREDFMDNVDLFSLLKMRVGFGLSGNQEIGNYNALPTIYIGSPSFNFETGEEAREFNQSHNANPDLRWETNSEINVGVDFGMLNNRLSGSVEYYYKNTFDLLNEYSVPVPPNVVRNTWANAGEILNQGVELNLDYFAVNTSNFTWKSGLAFSRNKQKIGSLSSGDYKWSEADKKRAWLSGRGLVGDQNWSQFIEEGWELGTFYMPEYAGLSGDGKFLFYTAAGGVTRNVADAERRVVGHALPDFELGWSNYFTIFENFDVNMTIRGVYGNDVLNVTRMVFANPTILPSLNGLTEVLDEVERGLTDAPKVNSYYLEDGSFLRLDNITVGYNVPVEQLSWLTKLRVYVSSNNLITLTNYTGLDPETTYDGLEFGLDQYNTYPKTRTLTFGAQVHF